MRQFGYKQKQLKGINKVCKVAGSIERWINLTESASSHGRVRGLQGADDFRFAIAIESIDFEKCLI